MPNLTTSALTALLLLAAQSSAVKPHVAAKSKAERPPNCEPNMLEVAAASTLVIQTDFTYEAIDDSATAEATAKPVVENLSMHGTGFIADQDWHIVTASHVVDVASPAFIMKVSDYLKSNHRKLVPGSIKLENIMVTAMVPNAMMITHLFVQHIIEL